MATQFLNVSPIDMTAPGRNSPVADAPALRSIVSAASDLVPMLRQKALATETARCVSEETTRAFREAGFFRLMQPQRYGGYEYGFTAFIDVITELGRGCTSSAWCCAIGAGHQWLIAGFPEQAQKDVWQGNPDAFACVSYAPTGTTQKVDGGCLIEGRWQFVSNVDNSEWVILGAQFPPAPSGAGAGTPPQPGFVLVPRADWTIEDNWYVAGQAGTGSKTIAIEKPTFVPDHRRLMIAAAASGSSPGTVVNTNRIYRVPMLSALPVCLVSPLLGTALGAVEEFVNLCSTRVTRGAVGGGGNRLSEFFPVQSRVAEASALADAARLLIHRDTAEVERMTQSGQALSVDQRIRNRRDHAFAARLARDAVEAVFSAVGGSGLASNQPIQRMWRDANAIVRHITLNWDAVSSMVGQHLLGLTPKGQY
ncbi:MAG TPA: acyl-CoA dehydrogenase family protein [Steroidobacteraceae bacterium]|jgi:alkylation response protein AidB-like acyl-CoA dehydrogenase|nr:acyl-CoA dehydrogenase family protein [Steroidobacteraceae bacterium]